MELSGHKQKRNLPLKTVILGITSAFAAAFAMTLIAAARFHGLEPALGRPIELSNWAADYSLLFVLLLLVACAFYLYIAIYQREIAHSPRHIGAMLAIFAISYGACLIFGAFSVLAMPLALSVALYALENDPKHHALPAAFFMAAALAAALLVKSRIDGEWAVREAVYAVLGTLIGGSVAVILLRREVTRVKLILYTVLAGLTYVPLYFLVLGINANYAAIGRDFTFYAVGLLGTPILTQMLQPLIDWAFNLVSVVRLLEICNMNHPLLKRMAEEAPGTYHHCMTVAKFAEECAAAIGENRYLARAAGYFHDAGKLEAADFFSENQGGGENPHDEIGPEVSCDIIRAHTKRGLAVCKKYRIPAEITAGMLEHHGTLAIYYFYAKAMELNDGKTPDLTQYQYTGPLPQTKINALIMICDGAEAALRAQGKSDHQAVRQKVEEIIRMRVNFGQFDECPITFRDLDIIKDVIVEIFCGLRHDRIKYEDKKY